MRPLMRNEIRKVIVIVKIVINERGEVEER